MRIRVCKTVEWSGRDWETYAAGFNEVFSKDFPVEYFKHKYLNTCRGCSCHSLLLDADAGVAGGCTTVLCRYRRAGGEDVLIGLVVDVFIRKAFRTDPLMLLRMYRGLRALLEEEGAAAAVAVPNAAAYPYWKNVVKWLEADRISYWALPVRGGRVLGVKGPAGAALDAASRLFAGCARAMSAACALTGAKARGYAYSVCEGDPYYASKFDGADYVKFTDGHTKYVYKVADEGGVRTGYLLTAEEGGARSFRAFRKAVSAILAEKVDIVLYVGSVGFFQTLLLRVPRRFEPKPLPLMCDMISRGGCCRDMLDIRSWDFGLRNYDVR